MNEYEPITVERLARALPYWRESNRETCIADARVILDNLGLPPGEPIERHSDEVRNAALRAWEAGDKAEAPPITFAFPKCIECGNDIVHALGCSRA